jgi:SAM-dependent methyltransferase
LIFQDQSFDVIICSHVLEHIPDDKTAMMELYRVLVSEGVAYIQVPYRRDHETDEDPNITDPKEREKRWGQFDHVRLYGKDLKLRLESVGFLVKENDYAQKLDEESCKKYGLWDDVIFQCTKP